MKNRKWERGVSLLEIVIALAVIATLGTAFVMWQQASTQVRNMASIERGLESLARTMLIYSGLNNRLPCPAIKQDGAEACLSDGARYFPKDTVGAGKGFAHFGSINYVLLDTSLSVSGGHDIPAIGPLGNGTKTTFDMMPLGQALGQSVVGTAGHRRASLCQTLIGNGQPKRQVALLSVTADNAVHARPIYAAELWDALECTSVVMGVVRSYAALASQTAYLEQAYDDFHELKKIQEMNYASDTAAALIGVLGAVNQTKRAGVKNLGAKATDLCALCPDAPGITTAMAAGLTVKRAAGLVLSVATAARFVANQAEYADRLVSFAQTEDNIRQFHNEVKGTASQLIARAQHEAGQQ